MEVRVRCNECGIKDCKSYENLTIAKGCSMFLPFEDFKTPMLLHLMEDRKATDTTKVLEHFGFRIQEIGRYPYFKLYV